MKDLLQQFETKQPEIVFEWADRETDAKGWVVINSLRGGAAGGGTRMRKGLDKREVESLAKTMEIKFTVSGPAIGGAKSGINFDPADPRKHGVLQRWYKAVYPLLKNYYGTGGDLNVDEIHEVIPITESYGLWHPQEGVINGHLKAAEPERIKLIGQLRYGVSKLVEGSFLSPLLKKRYTVADLITGYGVSESIRHYYNTWGGSVKGKKVLIQGWGNVAAAAGYFMAMEGAKVVGIIDRVGGVINTEGFTLEEVAYLFENRNGNTLAAEGMMDFDTCNNRVWDCGAQVFIPAAASRLVTREQVDRLADGGLEVIASGANVPFADSEIFFGPIMEYADSKAAVIPDFIANCGMARVFAYLMESHNTTITDEMIFNDVSQTMQKALAAVYARSTANTGVSATAFGIALEKLV